MGGGNPLTLDDTGESHMLTAPVVTVFTGVLGALPRRGKCTDRTVFLTETRTLLNSNV